jgi:hypothetical protein
MQCDAFCAKFAGYRLRTVRTAVIDNQDLVGSPGLRSKIGENRANEIDAVPTGYDRRDGRHSFLGYDAETQVFALFGRLSDG